MATHETVRNMSEEQLYQEYDVDVQWIQFYDAETMKHTEPKKVYFLNGKMSNIFDVTAHVNRTDMAKKRAARQIDDAGWPVVLREEQANTVESQAGYEATHNMTDLYVELYRHDRSCDCPRCCGDGE